MEPTSEGIARSRDALRREHKDQIVLQVAALCRRLRIRALAGGGSVLTANGIITPAIAPSMSIVVDPASSVHLLHALREAGWREGRPRWSLSPLPAAKSALTHDDWTAGLDVFSVIPGFFADPEETFDLLWERRRDIPLRGEPVPSLDRLASVLLASHNSLDGRGPHASLYSVYFAEQFRQVLGAGERSELGVLIGRVGGGGEMSSFLDALGEPPIAYALPSEAYVRWRLRVETAPEQLRRAVALLELSPAGRRQLYESKSGRPHAIADLVAMFRVLPATVRVVFGARRRWRAAND